MPPFFLRKLNPEIEHLSLSAWHWLLAPGYIPTHSTTFGDLFLSSVSGEIFFLNTLDACLVSAADNEAHLLEQLENEELQNEIFMPKLSHAISEALGPISNHHCYSAIIPPSLGGSMTPSNFHILSLADHLASLGSIQAKVANDPQGTRYRVQPNGG